MPVERERDRAGQHLLFQAGVRSKLAKKGGDALSDLANRDIERDGRYPAAAEIGTGGELVPRAPELPKLRDTVTNPDYVAVDASRDRLALAHLAGVLELALDASDTVVPKNSLEKMLVHQMAVLHRQTMKLSALMDDLSSRLPHEGLQLKSTSSAVLAPRSRAWRRRISLACSPCNVSAPAASSSLRSSTCMSLMVDRRSLRRSLAAKRLGADIGPGEAAPEPAQQRRSRPGKEAVAKPASATKEASNGKPAISTGKNGNGNAAAVSAEALWAHAKILEPGRPWRAFARELGVNTAVAQDAAHCAKQMPPNLSQAAAARFMQLPAG